jgi:uncharacterized protein
VLKRSLPLAFISAALAAQQPASAPMAGHWEGLLQFGPGFVIQVDLKEGTTWSGTLMLPDMQAKVPMEDLKVSGNTLSFKVNLRGEATFQGQLTEDGKQIKGSAVSANQPNMPFTLSRDKAQISNPVQDRYTKQEIMIPMRDGVKLFTAIYAPKDSSKPHPILIQRTPYSVAPYGTDKFRRSIGPSPLFLKEDYIIVYQDVRGRWMSEGEFVDMRPVNANKGPKDIDEGTDTFDSIEWLTKNVPNNNGRVGQWGISYPGHYTAQGMLSGHSALKAVSPQAPMVDLWQGDDSYHNGAFQLAANFDFFTFFQSKRDKPSSEGPKQIEVGSEDGYHYYLKQANLAALDGVLKGREPIWRDYVKNTSWNAYWKARDLRPHLKNIQPAVLTVGGWFDAEDLYGPLNLYKYVEANSKNDNRLVMGPWSHGQWASGDGSKLGNAQFGDKTSAWYQKEVELPFFNHHLKGDAAPKLAEATIFETGANRWRNFETWPPKNVQKRSLYFEAQGKLSFDKPSSKIGFEEFVSDPAKPVPYTQDITFGYTRTYMTEDQRFASTRPDVIVFETEPLKEDITVAGPIAPTLHVSTSGTDSDWIVKVIDVFPDDAKTPTGSREGWQAGGYQMLLRGDAIRGKFRKSVEKPMAFRPGVPDMVSFTLNDVCHTFQKGHRIMVQVQCSWFPLVDRNPQSFTDIPNAKPSEFRKATQRVFHSSAMPSRIDVLELKN